MELMLHITPLNCWSYKDSIVAISRIQNSIILIQTTEYYNFMLE